MLKHCGRNVFQVISFIFEIVLKSIVIPMSQEVGIKT